MRVAAAAIAVAACGCGRIGFDDERRLDATTTDAATPDATAAIALVAHAIVNGKGLGLNTPELDTRSASLIVLAECTWDTGTPTPPTDSADNVWQGLPSYGSNMNPANIEMFYAYAPATSASQVFSDTGDDFLSLAVLAFSGTALSPAVFAAGSGATGATPLQPGAVATHADTLVVTFACSGQSVATAVSIDDGFELVDHVLDHDAGGPEDMASAFLVTAGVADPSWPLTGDSEATAAIAAFLPP